MKRKILISVIALLFGTMIYGQNASVDEVFEKYALKEGFTTVHISGELLNMANSDEELKDIGIGNIKILAVEDSSLNANLNFYEDIIPKLDLRDYTKLLNIKEKNEQVVMMSKKEGRGKQESLMIVGGSDNVIIYIEGNLNLAEISKVAELIDSETVSLMNDSE